MDGSALALYDRCVAYTQAGLRDYGYVTDLDLTCQELRRATATSRAYYPDRSFVGAVYDRRGELVRSTLRFNDRDIVPADPQRIDDVAAISAVPSVDGHGVYGGILFPILGHFLLESLARLWPLLWNGARHGDAPPVYFHHWPGLDLPHFMANPLYRASLAAFGLDPGRVRLIDRATRFERLLLAQTASVYHRSLDRRMIEVADRVAGHIMSAQPRAPSTRAIYLSRSAWPDSKRIVNEEAVDALMAELGFEVVHTQTLSPIDLMTRLTQAGTVVASDGSHAHLALFCGFGTRVLMLDTRPVPSQFAIAALRRFDTLHLPLFETPHYRGVLDVPPLRPLIETALSKPRWVAA